MKWWHFLIMSAVNTVLGILPMILNDEEAKADLKVQMFNLYYAIQRTWPELVVKP